MRAPTRGPLAAVLAFALAAPALAADDVQKLLKTLARDKNADDRARAAERLGDLKAVEAVPALAAALKDKDARVRAHAAGALLEIGEPGKAAMPALHEALLDSDPTTVWNAAGALRNMGTVTTDLMFAYQRLLAHHDCDMRVSAAAAIVEYAKPEELLPVALGCRKEDFAVAREARELMAEIAKRREAVDVLTESLADESPEVREWAAKALGDHKPAVAKPAIPALEAVAADDDNEAVRHAATRALFKIRGH